MKHYGYTFLYWVILCFVSVPGYAVKAVSTPVIFTRSDGTKVQVRIYGDEFFSYKKDAAGFLVEQGKDGLLYYVDYSTGALRFSEQKSTSIPVSLLADLREQNIWKKRSLQGQGSMPIPVAWLRTSPLLPREIKTPVLLVEFADVKFSLFNPVNDFTRQLNRRGNSLDGATGSAADYFNANFNGRCTFVFDVFPVIITLPREKAYYGADGTTGVDARLTELFADVCQAAVAAGMDFSKYDWAGEGQVRDVAFIYAGTSQAETGISSDIWPQYHMLRDVNYNGKTILAFSCSAELSSQGLMKGRIAGIGTFCHEFAHSLGLPDMYDTNGETEGLSQELGETLSLMNEGNYLNYGRTPPYFTAVERELTGHPVTVPMVGTSYFLAPVGKGGEILRIDSRTSGEYFLIECRNPEGWDAYIGGGGMVVYHVDKSEQMYGGIASVYRWQYNNVNAFAKHPCAKIFSSSGAGKEGLFFPAGTAGTQLSSYGTPRFADWSDKPLPIHLSGISYDQKVVRFDAVQGMLHDASLPFPVTSKVFPYQYDCRVEWTSNQPAVQGGRWRVCWKPISAQNREDAGEERFTLENYCYLSHLVPATEYEVSVVFEKESSYGERGVFRCSTLPISSMLPYIPAKGGYLVGEVLDLRVLNLTEVVEQVVWRVNDKEQKNTRLLLNTSGIFVIGAEIQYKDGSLERIVKKIKVN